jgi:hypothetical protein
MVKYLSFHNSSFALRYFLNCKMAKPQCDTHTLLFWWMNILDNLVHPSWVRAKLHGGEGGGSACPLTAPEVHEVSVVHRKSVIVIVMNTKFADNKNDRKGVTGRQGGRQGAGFVSARAVCHIGIRGWRVTESRRKGVIKLVLEMYVYVGAKVLDQNPPVPGWMVKGQETVFSWVSVP